MEIPTVKSCGPFDLSFGGFVIGYIQIAIHMLAFLVNVRFGSLWLTPMTIMALAVNIAWIYGIQEKKVIFMLPAFVPFIIASLAGIVLVSIYPIAVSVFIFADMNDFVHFSGRRCEAIFYSWIVFSILTGFVIYLTIVEYSLCKLVEETHRRESTRLPYSAACSPQMAR